MILDNLPVNVRELLSGNLWLIDLAAAHTYADDWVCGRFPEEASRLLVEAGFPSVDDEVADLVQCLLIKIAMLEAREQQP